MTAPVDNGAPPLSSKLHRPGLPRTLLVRPRLLKLLNEGLQGSLTLIVAPAGFGKTTLVSSWLAGLEAGDPSGGKRTPVAWLTFDENDSDFNLAIAYFVAALRTIYPDACPRTLTLLDALVRPALNLVSDTLNNEIDALPGRFVLVLDDFYQIRNPAMTEFLAGWLRHWPRPLHLIIISRYPPSLPLAGLRAGSQLTEIRSRDLRFSPQESIEFLRRALENSLDENTLSLIEERLEGWIAGLKLVTLSLSRSYLPNGLAAVLLDSKVFITDYLLDEVLAHQSPGVQQFLLKTSVVEQFCISLCEALLGSGDPDQTTRSYLDEIEAAELFVTRLEDQREWFRYHQLFRDLLQQRLLARMGQEQVDHLHLRAALWYAGQDLMDKAIQHALQAGKLEQAIAFMQQRYCDLLNRTDGHTLEHWLSLLPEDLIQQKPQLLLMRAWVNEFRWDFAATMASAARAEALLEADNDMAPAEQDLLRGLLAVLKSEAAYHRNQPEQSFTLANQALTLLPEGWRGPRGLAALYSGVSLYAIGRTAEAEKLLVSLYHSDKDRTDSFALRVLLGLVIIYLRAGRMDDAERAAQTMLWHAQRNKEAQMEGWSQSLLGLSYYSKGELGLAEAHYRGILKLYFPSMLSSYRIGMIGLALTLQAQGRSEEALSTIEQLSRSNIELFGHEEIETTAVRTRLRHQLGETEAAQRWARNYDFPPVAIPSLPGVEGPQMTRARILIASENAEDVQLALQVLNTMAELAEKTCNIRTQIEVLAMRSLARLALGDIAVARETLLQAVKLARKGGTIQAFVDLGPKMQNLLYQIAQDSSVSQSVRRILAAFPQTDAGVSGQPGMKKDLPVNLAPAPDWVQVERLTPREVEVLKLLAESISHDEIAARLGISYATTKRHTINIYAKLGVHSRWDAVACAVRLGILPPR